MQRWRWVAVVLLAFGILTAPRTAPLCRGLDEQASEAPCAEFSETEYHLGRIADGSDYSHAFRVRNVGTGVLEIFDVVTG